MKINRRGPQGNAWIIIAYVRELIVKSGREKEWPKIDKRMRSGSYENLCKVATEVTFGSITFTDGPEDDEDGGDE